ncbi:putative F-box/LRR-repeat protein [Cardamine amara subsp. amara]|uniref:F-box/LRR-repeat protein n=1 Tax=Cardamine amara subsp. amara TaxID=228776 RepID=A0ABD1A020_CARAN
MANRRERRNRRQRRRNLRNRKIQRQGIMDGADFINSIPDEIRPGIIDSADFINSIPDEIQPGIMDGADFINSMPDEILHHILSFMPTESAMKTCVLSKRWRHVWCESPSLDIDCDCKYKARNIKQNLISYTAPKITSFKFRIDLENSAAEIDSWLEFAISRNVQNLSVKILARMIYGVNLTDGKTYNFPDFFYRSSSLKQLSVLHENDIMKPRCTCILEIPKEVVICDAVNLEINPCIIFSLALQSSRA